MARKVRKEAARGRGTWRARDEAGFRRELVRLIPDAYPSIAPEHRQEKIRTT